MKNKAFSETLRSRLRGFKYAHWATELTEDTAEALMWAIGESHMRLHEDVLQGSFRDLHPAVRARILEGIRIAREIVGGCDVDVEDVRRRIRDAVSEAWPEGS